MRKFTVVFLLIVWSGLLACGLSNQLTSPVPTPTPVQYPVGLASARDNLADLQSYRTQLKVDFSGNRNGDLVEGNIETSTEVTQAPEALHHSFRLEGQLPKMVAGVSEYYRFGDQVYLKKAGDTLWSQFSGTNTTPAAMGFLNLEKLIVLPATVSTPPITETINGLSVTRYIFAETDLSDPDVIFDQVQGGVWVATPGDYVVKYVISTTQRVTLPDPAAHLFDEGQLILQYEVSDVDEDFAINPPADFPTTNTLNNLPRLSDADIVSTFPNLIEYVSATTPVSATQFYQNELAAQEWTEENVSVFEEKARLVFSKEGQTLTIIITPLDNDQNIKVLLDIR